MKKLLFAFLVFLICACSGNTVVGTWVLCDSDISVGEVSLHRVSKVVFSSDGTFEETHAMQGDKEADFDGALFSLSGWWELLDDGKLVVHVEKCTMGGSVKNNVKDVEYSIVSMDEKELILEAGGKEYKYRRRNE